MPFKFCIHQGLERFEMVQAETLPMTTWGPLNPEQDQVTIRDWTAYYSIGYSDYYPIAESALQYLLWRDQLQQLVSFNQQHDPVNDSGPFRELLRNDYIIWPRAARKLLVDFSQWEKQAKARFEFEFYQIYEQLRTCLTNALETCPEGRYFALKPDWDKEGECWMFHHVTYEAASKKFTLNDEHEI
jgi:hypothetical protein